MSREKSSWRIACEDRVVVGLWALLRRSSAPLATRLGTWLLKAMLLLMPRRRLMMRDHLSASFPAKTSEDVDLVVEGCLTNLARSMWYFARLPEVSRGERGPAFVMEGFEHLQAGINRGRGVVVFTAHYGCWEAIIVAVAQRFSKVAVAARPLDNPLLDARVNQTRECTGATIIPRRQLLKEGLRHLRDNGVLGVLIDQNYSHGGLFVDFFGRAAATTSIVSSLARRTDSLVIPMHARWIDGRVHILCEAPLPLSPHANPTLAIAEDTQRMTKVVEGWIRQDPTQWLWLHNRWKRKPEPADMIYTPQPPLKTL